MFSTFITTHYHFMIADEMYSDDGFITMPTQASLDSDFKRASAQAVYGL